MPELGAHAVVDAAEVDVDHLAPVVDRIVLAADQWAADAGHVRADVKTAERFNRVSDGALRDLWVSDVTGEGRGVRDVARHALGPLRLHVHDDHTSPLGRHPANDRLADA